ncbi:MAG: hypothetical protein GY929_02175 [Actinomycetia bacterium]|nr:hypothetical protein [Actinomycetes bacterium]
MERCPLCTAILPAESARCTACGKKLAKDKARKRGLGRFAKKSEADEALDGPEGSISEEGNDEPFDHTALFGEDEAGVPTAEAVPGEGAPPPPPPPPAPEPEAFDHSALFAESGISGGPVPDPSEPDTSAVKIPEAVSFSRQLSADEISAPEPDGFSVEAFEVEPFKADALFVDDSPPKASEPVGATTDSLDDCDDEPFDPDALFGAGPVSSEPVPSPPPPPAPPSPAPTAVHETPPLVLADRERPDDPAPAPSTVHGLEGDDDLFAAFAEGFFDD